MSFRRALKWSFLAELVTKAIQPVVFILLARLLTPGDFGVMAAALMVIAFSQVFWEAGMGKALIQRQGDIEEAACAAFWINIGLGILLAAILYYAAEPVARIFFKDTRVTDVIRVMTIQILLGSVSAVHIALFQKEMLFQKLFWIRFTTVGLPGLISIPLAWNGFGYWALVAGTLLGQLMQVILLYRMSAWRPAFKFNILVAKDIGKFGSWVVLSGLLAWFYIWADSLVVGAYLGSNELGLYRTGGQFALMIFAIFFSPATPVIYSQLSKMNQQEDKMRGLSETIVQAMIILAIPVAVLLYSLSESISEVFFGQQWQGIGFVIGLLALTHGISWVVGMNGEIYRAIGKPALETVVMTLALTVYITGYLISIRYGFEEFVWTRLGLAIVALIMHLWIMRRALAVNIFSIINRLILVSISASVSVYLVSVGFSNSKLSGLPGLLLEGATGLVAVGLVIYMLERNRTIRDLYELRKEVEA